MTESDWVVCANPRAMLNHFRGMIRQHSRKLRLFAVACCRRIGDRLRDGRSHRAIEVAENYAEGGATAAELAVAYEAAQAAHTAALIAQGKVGASAEWAAAFAADGLPFFAATRASNFASVAAGDSLDGGPEHAAQADLLRDLFGPLPFRTMPLDPTLRTWNGGLVVQLAVAACEHRHLPGGTLDGARLAVLADALEDAGCDNEEMLQHCRQQGQVHVRGCWALDLLLGKS